LPDDGPVNGLPALPVPYKGRLALVGDSYGIEIFGLEPGLGESLRGDG
jgi:hypothetical protein